MGITHASNAIVSLCNFYAEGLADLLQQIKIKDTAIQQLSGQLKAAKPNNRLTAAEQQGVDGAIRWHKAYYSNFDEDKEVNCVNFLTTAVRSLIRERNPADGTANSK